MSVAEFSSSVGLAIADSATAPKTAAPKPSVDNDEKRTAAINRATKAGSIIATVSASTGSVLPSAA
jgi:hypothetical protein